MCDTLIHLITLEDATVQLFVPYAFSTSMVHPRRNYSSYDKKVVKQVLGGIVAWRSRMESILNPCIEFAVIPSFPVKIF